MDILSLIGRTEELFSVDIKQEADQLMYVDTPRQATLVYEQPTHLRLGERMKVSIEGSSLAKNHVTTKDSPHHIDLILTDERGGSEAVDEQRSW